MKVRVYLYLAAVLVPLLSSAFADGVVYHVEFKTLAAPQFILSSELGQDAIIFWNNGVERLLIMVRVGGEENTHIWIVPVPANPEQVSVSHIRSVELSGLFVDVRSRFVSRILTNTYRYMYFTQGWGIFYHILSGGVGPFLAGSSGHFKEKGLGVVVHRSLQSYNLSTSVITAKNPEELEAFLKERYGVYLPRNAQKKFEEYINHTFVISEARGTPEAMGILITFPVKQPYYPLKLTSLYRNLVVPIKIVVSGFWVPTVWIPGTDVEHAIYASVRPATVYIDGNKAAKLSKITKVKIEAPAKHFEEDLWFRPAVLPTLLMDRRVEFGATVLTLIAVLSLSGLLAWVYSSRKREFLLDYIAAGVLGIMTPLATYVYVKAVELPGEYPGRGDWKKISEAPILGALLAIIAAALPAAMVLGLNIILLPFALIALVRLNFELFADVLLATMVAAMPIGLAYLVFEKGKNVTFQTILAMQIFCLVFLILLAS